MTGEHRMEQLSRVYAQAIAAMCGCNWSVPTPDYGIDLSLRRVTYRREGWGEIGVPLDIQLRSTAGATVTPDHVVYDEEKAMTDKRLPTPEQFHAWLSTHGWTAEDPLPADPEAGVDFTYKERADDGQDIWVRAPQIVEATPQYPLLVRAVIVTAA